MARRTWTRRFETLRGYDTGLADPHGVAYDDNRKELVVANHGNWTELRPYSPYDPLSKTPQVYEPGRFEPPSIRIFAASAEGNTKPLRSISGNRTGLNWPMGLDVDAQRDEILVANYGDNSIHIFRRTAEGDVGPKRVSEGRPDRNRRSGGRQGRRHAQRDLGGQLLGSHGARSSTVTPAATQARNGSSGTRRPGTPALTFTNAAAAAYDTKRDALIVPN